MGKPFRIGAGSRPDSHGPEKDAEALDFHDLSSPPDPAATIRIEHAGDHLDVIADPEGTPVKIGEIPGGGGGVCGPAVISFGVGDAPAGISLGVKRYIQVPYNMDVLGWSLSANVPGSLEIDVWVSPSPPPTIVDSVVGLSPPSLSSSQFSTGDTTGWSSTTINSGDWVAFAVTSISGITRFTMTLSGDRS